MTIKQTLLRRLYPIIRKLGKWGKNGTVLKNEANLRPKSSFYDLQVNLSNGKPLDFSELKGKKVVLVNTASDCGYTGQYAELQDIHQRLSDRVKIIGFPANDFAAQEKGSDSEISQFCQVNYGVSFPIAKKGMVVKKGEQQRVFQWLSNKEQNGWNNHAPDWNFSKYIVNEEGILTHYFGPSVSPVDQDFLDALK